MHQWQSIWNGNLFKSSLSRKVNVNKCIISDKETEMNLIDLPTEILLRLFLQLDSASLHNCRRLCKFFNNWIVRNIWKSHVERNILQARVDRNWITNTYKCKDKFCKLDTKDQYIIRANENFIVTQNINNLNDTYQEYQIYNIKDATIWKTGMIGPMKTIPVLQHGTFISNNIALNKEIIVLIYESDNNSEYNINLKVWDTVSTCTIYEETFLEYCGMNFDEQNSRIIIIQTNCLQILTFSNCYLKSRIKHSLSKELIQCGTTTTNYRWPYILYWQPNETNHLETSMFVWKFKNNDNEISNYLQYIKFKENHQLIVENTIPDDQAIETELIKDTIFLSNTFIVLVQMKKIYDIQWEHFDEEANFMQTKVVLLKDNVRLTEIYLETEKIENSFFKNTKFIFDERRLIVKMNAITLEDVVFVLTFKEMMKKSTKLNYKLITAFNLKNLAYKYHPHYDIR